MEQNENTLSVLKIAPGQQPQQVEIDNDLKALQQAVGGSIKSNGQSVRRDALPVLHRTMKFTFSRKGRIIGKFIWLYPGQHALPERGPTVDCTA